jgi:hypothetical protein
MCSRLHVGLLMAARALLLRYRCATAALPLRYRCATAALRCWAVLSSALAVANYGAQGGPSADPRT